MKPAIALLLVLAGGVAALLAFDSSDVEAPRVALGPKGELSGRIVLPDGAFAQDAALRIESQERVPGTGDSPLFARRVMCAHMSLADGNLAWSVEHAPPGAYTAELLPYRIEQDFVVAPAGAEGAAELVLDFGPIAQLEVSVVAARSGHPVERCALQWTPAGSHVLETAVEEGPGRFRIVTGAQRIRVLVDGDLVSEKSWSSVDLEPGIQFEQIAVSASSGVRFEVRGSIDPLQVSLDLFRVSPYLIGGGRVLASHGTLWFIDGEGAHELPPFSIQGHSVPGLGPFDLVRGKIVTVAVDLP